MQDMYEIYKHSNYSQDTCNSIGEFLYMQRVHVAESLGIDVQQFINHTFIGGGSIYSMLNNETPNDFDIFTTSKEYAEFIKKHVISISKSKFNHKGFAKGHIEDIDCTTIVTDNAVSLFDGKYQIVTRYYGEPLDVIMEFDFKHNMNWECNGVIYKAFKECYISDNRLVYNEERARDIVGTITRIPKFIARGMTISKQEMAKMMLKLHSVGFNDYELDVLSRDSKGANKGFGSNS